MTTRTLDFKVRQRKTVCNSPKYLHSVGSADKSTAAVDDFRRTLFNHNKNNAPWQHKNSIGKCAHDSQKCASARHTWHNTIRYTGLRAVWRKRLDGWSRWLCCRHYGRNLSLLDNSTGKGDAVSEKKCRLCKSAITFRNQNWRLWLSLAYDIQQVLAFRLTLNPKSP